MGAHPKELTPKSLAMLVAGLIVLVGLSIWRLSGSPGGPPLIEWRGNTMGTTYTVKVVLRDTQRDADTARAEAHAAVEQALAGVNQSMSTYREDSELSRFNAAQTTEPFSVSADTASVFAHAQRVSHETGGAFDITVGPLVDAWGFGPEGPQESPTDAEIDALLAEVGYESIEVDTESNTIQKNRPHIACDLSALAKGYGVDEAARALDALGFAHYFIEVGGEIRTAGANPTGAPWRIGIEKPGDTGRAVHRIVALSGEALATSGDYRNFYTENGQRVSHTIDPRIGRPIRHNLASVSVIHDQCVLADAYATALMVLGPGEGLALAEELNLSVVFIVRTPQDTFEERLSTPFKAR